MHFCVGDAAAAPFNFTLRALPLAAAAGGHKSAGACLGQCLRVVHGECSGPNSCMKSSGPC